MKEQVKWIDSVDFSEDIKAIFIQVLLEFYEATINDQLKIKFYLFRHKFLII